MYALCESLSKYVVSILFFSPPLPSLRLVVVSFFVRVYVLGASCTVLVQL